MISCKCESALALDRVNSLIWAYNIQVNLFSKNATSVDWAIILNEWWKISNHTEMAFSLKVAETSRRRPPFILGGISMGTYFDTLQKK